MRRGIEHERYRGQRRRQLLISPSELINEFFLRARADPVAEVRAVRAI